jgi:hypothetical protein
MCVGTLAGNTTPLKEADHENVMRILILNRGSKTQQNVEFFCNTAAMNTG